MIRVNQRLSLPPDELDYSASRGGGPGGQHVNKTASKVTVRFDVRQSPSLSERQRQLLLARLESRLTNDGVLVLSSHESRSQAANREEVTDRLVDLLREALRPRKRRRKTRPTRASKERRLDAKKQRGQIKRTRGKVRRRDDG